jgi:hypothetical protein
VFEAPSPPTARVASVRGLRLHSRGDCLYGLDGDTLAEVNIVGCMITDDEILAQVSATASGLSGKAHSMVMVPVAWYEGLPRLRELLDIPSDTRALTTYETPIARRPIRRRHPNLKQLMQLEETSGKELAERWRRTGANHIRLSEVTREWFAICEDKIPDELAVAYLCARRALAKIVVRRNDRKKIAEFCELLATRLTAQL